MKILDDYLKLQEEIYKYFGYEEGWVVIPIDDGREYYWSYVEGSGIVKFADTLEELKSENGNYYENEIYTQRFLKKWVYKSKDFTMICVDTNTDGNKFLQIFDNSKEIK